MNSIKKFKYAGLSLLVFAFICLTGETLISAATDFSGQWTLNTSKSDLGQFGGRMAATKMKVTADAAGMSVEKTINGQNGETNTTDKLTFDGRETESPFFGNIPKRSTAKWADDGKSLNITWNAAFERDGNKTEVKGVDTWSLSTDGATLTISSSTAFGDNLISTKMVYDKAK